MSQVNYTLPQALMQSVVGILNELPSRVTRGVLNEIEMICSSQDQERNKPPAPPAQPPAPALQAS